jgi:hypothetical protein
MCGVSAQEIAHWNEYYLLDRLEGAAGMIIRLNVMVTFSTTLNVLPCNSV